MAIFPRKPTRWQWQRIKTPPRRQSLGNCGNLRNCNSEWQVTFSSQTSNIDTAITDKIHAMIFTK
jgi:hypothetical protein